MEVVGAQLVGDDDDDGDGAASTSAAVVLANSEMSEGAVTVFNPRAPRATPRNTAKTQASERLVFKIIFLLQLNRSHERAQLALVHAHFGSAARLIYYKSNGFVFD